MALETFVFEQDPFSSSSHPYKDYFYPACGFGFDPDYEMTSAEAEAPGKTDSDVSMLEQSLAGVNSWDSSPPMGEWDARINSSSSPENYGGGGQGLIFPSTVGRRRRRRARVVKNKVEVESQRMTHIAVERNRRKQMNEYLTELRTMMPLSYIHRGDQASIIGGAVNFVKELEQLLQSLKAAHRKEETSSTATDLSSSPFSDFFTFPQYSTDPNQPTRYAGPSADTTGGPERRETATADVEVTMVDAHANVKVLSRRQPKQLVKMVVGLQSMCLNILHLNVTTIDDMVLYSFSVRVEDNCQLTSVNEIAAAVYEMVGGIQEGRRIGCRSGSFCTVQK